MGHVTELSLDHDLGLTDGERELTGYDVVLWLGGRSGTDAGLARCRRSRTSAPAPPTEGAVEKAEPTATHREPSRNGRAVNALTATATARWRGRLLAPEC
jgi:hypothetical protein